jgi:hypothetical protein
MTIIARTALPKKPTAIYAYFDKIQFWALNPLERKTLAWLRQQCGRGGLHVDNRPARFSTRYRQRIELRQPSDGALSWLAQRDDALVNRVEIAVDYIFPDRVAKDDAFEHLHRHLVRRWHGKNQKIKVVCGRRGETGRNTSAAELVNDIGDGETRYDAGRAPNKLVFYRNQYSRITGELICLHLEWHLNGLKPVQAAGIESGQDLLEFNHRQFWQKRLLLFDVDRRRLGRLIRNRITGKRSRASEIKQTGGFKINIDGRTGEVHTRAYDTVQELIDRFKASNQIHRALVPISSEGLLPGVGLGVRIGGSSRYIT